ncbi:mRNA splicing protein [Tieghemiomyces parasiticus]|uniref:Pre-mRNA-splicing factor SLU7 n=1 Tax=Tieghemiomyces parasiticus TaxID=78921 RepID=A0A9W8DND8_9FUNG|nr:mRNA splicing protein [Tieghemiomyces parasiticus]
MSSGNSSTRLNRDDYVRLKDLDAARKAGTAPAEVDDEGREINPHIPEFMVKAPWYVSTGRPSLNHQRILETYTGTKPAAAAHDPSKPQWYARGQKKGPAATTYRKGACQNCGALSHKTKACLERPRKLGAKWTGQDIQADEVVVDGLDLTFEEKRDRWNGYDPSEHKQLVEEWELIEERRKKRKAEELDRALREGNAATAKDGKAPADQGDAGSAATATPETKDDTVVNKLKRAAAGHDSTGGSGSGSGRRYDSDDSGSDDDRYAEKSSMPGQKMDAKSRTTVRNLRIREDTAKYLRNLDPNSAHYDPKTRSMRDNPYQTQDPHSVPFAGDNFVRYSGEAGQLANLQLFAWEAAERGNDQVHLQANPTLGELLHREYQDKKEGVKLTSRDAILDKYGGAEHLQAPPKELLLAQSERYVEYSRSGKVIRGQERAVPRSKYEEDVCPGNHTTVWGSYWEDGKWGYKCCQATLRNAYCTAQH